MLFVAGAMACGTQGAPKTADPERADPYTTDTTYLRRVAYLKALSYKVPLDSFTKLHVMLAAASPQEAPALTREISCETARIIARYGIIPANLAFDRVDDSLRSAQPELFRRAADNYKNLPVESTVTSDAICKMVGMARAPDSLNIRPLPEAVARRFKGQMAPQ